MGVYPGRKTSADLIDVDRKKFEAVYQGARTSRLLHLRYLAGSRAWREHTQKENYDQEDEGVKGEDDEEGGDGSMFLSGGMSAISRSYLISNVPLIKNRIIRAVREAKGNLVHSEVGRTIVRLFVLFIRFSDLPAQNVFFALV